MSKSNLHTAMEPFESSLQKRTVDDIARDVLKKVEEMHVRLIVIQGPIGAGKTTLAMAIAKHGSAVVLSADDFFTHDGVYKFDGNALARAHADCQRRAMDALVNTDNYVVIDNCNKNMADASEYLRLDDNQALVVRLVPKNQNDAIRCGNRSVHRVPSTSVMRTYNSIGPLEGPGIVTMSEPVLF